jgi:hypothetical protein
VKETSEVGKEVTIRIYKFSRVGRRG